MYERFSRFVPKKIKDAFARELDYLGIEVESGKFVGFVFSFALALGFGIALNIYIFYEIPILLSFVFFTVLIIAGMFFWLSIVAESKGRFVERILPDALQLIASNLRAGLTTERALLISARPEFGPLELELKKASKRILTGTKIQDALSEIPKHIQSKTLEKTFWLINKGISSGGQIADVLTQLADDLREQNSLREEIKANISIYIMLIFFSAAVGAPIMLGISSFIVQVLNKQMSSIQVSSNQEVMSIGSKTPIIGGIPKTKIDTGFVFLFSEIMLFFTVFFAALVMGVINTGSEKQGLKYLPILLIVSFALFFGIRFVLSTVFKQLV